MKVSGDAADRVELEDLSANPELPDPADLSFSEDEGKSAIEKEVSPLSIEKAALMSDVSSLPAPGLPVIPTAPFIVQASPAQYDIPSVNILSKPNFTKGTLPPDLSWEFKVFDDQDRLWHQQTGTGLPPDPLAWNGADAGGNVMDPNRSYFSYVVLRSSDQAWTYPGEATRFMAFAVQAGSDSIVNFSERVYKQDDAAFSRESQIYRDDLIRRLSRLPAGSTWDVSVYEPESRFEIMGPRRLKTWIAFLQKSLGIQLAENRVLLKKSPNEDSFIQITVRGIQPTLLEKAMRGQARLIMPGREPISEIVRLREVNNTLIVELRHDRLFLPGTTTLRDDSLVPLAEAMATVRTTLASARNNAAGARQFDMPPPQRNIPAEETKEEKKDKKKKGKEEKETKHPKAVLIKSFTQKPRDEKIQSLDEDPKLSAIRSKLLFQLFAKEGLINE